MTISRLLQPRAAKHWLFRVMIAIAASLVGFVLHVTSVESVAQWIEKATSGLSPLSSWDVRIPAMFTSIETGLALVICYGLVRRGLACKTALGKGVLFSILMLAVQGRLLRQPFMDWLIGNPIFVVLVQDGMSYLVWLAMGLITATLYERLISLDKA